MYLCLDTCYLMLLKFSTMKYIYILCAVLLIQQNCSAQAIDASPTGVMISHGHPKRGWMVSYAYMNMFMEDNFAGTKKVSDDYIFSNYLMSPVDMKMDMHMLMLMYGISGKLSAMLMADYRLMHMNMNMYSTSGHNHGGSSETSTSLKHEMKTSGIGDVKLYALYKLLTAEHTSLTASMGINLPVGSITIDDDGMYNGQHLPYMMQLGSGSYDLLPGITVLSKHKRISYSAQLLATIRPVDNTLDYHYGNEFLVNVWGAYQFHKVISASLRTEGISSSAIEGKDKLIYAYMEPGADPENYGGRRINGYGGLNIYITKSFMKGSKLTFEYGLPFYQNVNGTQLGLKSTLYAGFTKSF